MNNNLKRKKIRYDTVERTVHAVCQPQKDSRQKGTGGTICK